MSNELPPPGKAFPPDIPMPDKTKPSPEYVGYGDSVEGADGYIMKHRGPHAEVAHDELSPQDAGIAWDFAMTQIPHEFPYQRKMVDVYGCNIAYVDEGEGDPIIFLHGAPESSYIWRNIMPYLHYNECYLKKTIPSLECYGHPGEVTNEYDVRWRVEHPKNHETAFVGTCIHFVQEDHPEAIGRATADWYRRHLAPNPNVWCTDAGPKDDMMPKNLKM